MGTPVDVEELRSVGLAAGLAAVGVASVEPFLGTRQHLVERREQGLHGGMGFTYRNPVLSTEPARLLRNATSLVVGAYDYLRADVEPAEQPVGRVARYVWQDHYDALAHGLRSVAERLRAAGWRSTVVADQNHLVDREAAYRAGLGWYGKSSNLLLEGQGSWFILGSVVTDAPLPPATPQADGCASCRRCLDGCPTGAIVAPGVVDANRCLAWLVQAPGPFPRWARVALGDRIYGCDDCQEVCPPNQRRVRVETPAAPSDRARPWVALVGLLAASNDELLDRFGRWYIAERDPRWLRRNALVALGNVGQPADPAVADAIARSWQDPDPMLRAHAVWAAGQLGLAREALAAVAHDPAPEVREEADELRRLLAHEAGA